MSHKYRKIIDAVYNEPWAIRPGKMEEICELLELRLQGVEFTPEEIAQRIQASSHHTAESPLWASEDAPAGRIAVLNVFGTISQRMNMLTAASGGTSTEQLAAAFDSAMADDSISAIVLNIDSPGGRTAGVSELADKIFAARGSKPIIAVANTTMDSAAYWIGSAADEIVATPSAESIGSIGVLFVHRDRTQAHQKEGTKHEVIRSVEFKAEGNPFEPLTRPAREHIQKLITAVHDRFVTAVARNRGVSAATVDAGYGQGRDFTAQHALTAGLIDRIDTLENVLTKLGARSATTSISALSSSTSHPHTSNSVQEPTSMDPKITAQLIALDLCSEAATEEQQQAALKTFFIARGQTLPEKPDEILKVLQVKPEPAAPSEPAPAVAPAAAAPVPAVTADTMTVENIIAAVNTAALSAEEKLDLQASLLRDQPTLSTKQVLDRINQAAVAANPSVGATTVAVTADSHDKLHVAALDAVLQGTWGGDLPSEIYNHRTGEMDAWKPTARPAHNLTNLNNFIQAAMINCGHPAQQVLGLAPMQIAQIALGKPVESMGLLASAGGPSYNVSGMFSNLLVDAANVTLRRSYNDGRTTFQVWAKNAPAIADFKAVNRVIAGELGDPKVIPEDGEFEQTTLTDGKEAYKLVVWGEIFSRPWQLMVNDALQSFTEIYVKMGRAMRRKQNRLVYGVLKDNAALQTDSIALFHADHTNLTTGAGAPSVPTLNTLTKKMMEQTGLDSASAALNLMGRWLLGAPALRGTILELLASTSNPAAASGNPGVTNIWQNGLEPVIEAELNAATTNGSDSAWYLIGDHSDCDTIEYAYLQGLEAPVVETETSFERLAIHTRIYHAFGTKAMDFRNMQKHNGA